MAQAALRLYRDILRLHARQLPPVMRELGDKVLRDEWRAMRTALLGGRATATQIAEFEVQWRTYADTLAKGLQQEAVCAAPLRARAPRPAAGLTV